MAIRYFIVCSIALIFFTPELSAAPAYGTDMPKKGKIRMGYQADVIFKRELKDNHGKIKSDQHFLDISYGALDWFVFDGKLGTGNNTKEGSDLPKLSCGYSFAGGYGFRIRFYDNADSGVKVVGGFHHISIHPGDRTANGDKYDSFLDDWQLDLLCSKTLGRFTPYAGGKASFFEYVYRANKGERHRISSRYNGGVIAGFDVKLKDDVTVNIEGRFIDENAINGGIYYTF